VTSDHKSHRNAIDLLDFFEDITEFLIIMDTI